jgi:protein SCO1
LLNASLMVLFVLSGATQAPASGDALPVLYPLPDFALTSDKDAPLARADLLGSVWIADFIFTSCAGPCPMMTRSMADVAERLSLYPEVKFVSVSVDPETDTPEVLAAYGEKFGADPKRWHFLTGEMASIQELAVNGFKIGSVDDPVIHSTKFCLVDKAGNIRGYFTGTEPEELDQLVAAVHQLIKE